MHSIRTGRGGNGSIRRTHSDIHVASDNFDFIIVLVIDNGLGFDGLVSMLGLDVYVHNEKLKIRSVKIAGSPHLVILFCIRFHVSRDILRAVVMYAEAGDTSKHLEHDRELELRL